MKRKQKTKRSRWKRLLSFASVMTVVFMFGTAGITREVEASALSEPQIAADAHSQSGQRVTWDCVWFGSYPQAEVVTAEMKESYTAQTSLSEELRTERDLVVSDSLYARLKSADGWDDNDDILLDGVKYRRLRKADLVNTSNGSGYYVWQDESTYHYFRYEPIKWRVLALDNDQAFLLADKVLDRQRYSQERVQYIQWEGTTIRSWLNGYDSSCNALEMDYRSRNFIDSAFTQAEQSAIAQTRVINGDIAGGTSGGKDTQDKIFLLSEEETYTETARLYGFVEDKTVYDEARRSRSSTFAKAMMVGTSTHTEYAGFCSWWLRSSSAERDYALRMVHSGWVEGGVSPYRGDGIGVRPALWLKLSTSSLYDYAGTVCSDGAVKENIACCTVSVADSACVYTGKPQTPEVTVTDGAFILREGRDYTVACSSNINAGIATVSVTGVGGYQGAVEKDFTIAKAEQKVTVNLSAAALWTGETAKLSVSGIGQITYRSGNTAVATVDGSGVVKGVAPGTAVITAYAAGDANHNPAAGTLTVTVTARSENGSNSGSGNGTGNGPGSGAANGGPDQTVQKPEENSPRKQTITVSSKTVAYKSKPFYLNARTDSGGKLTYQTSNKKVAAVSSKGKVTVKNYGQATITIKAAARGNYLAATKKITIKVVPKAVKIKKAASSGKRLLSVTWSKDKNADGYQMQLCTRKDFKKGTLERAFKKSAGSTKLSGLKSKKTYYTRLRAYKKVGKKTYYGGWSKTKKIKIK